MAHIAKVAIREHGQHQLPLSLVLRASGSQQTGTDQENQVTDEDEDCQMSETKQTGAKRIRT